MTEARKPLFADARKGLFGVVPEPEPEPEPKGWVLLVPIDLETVTPKADLAQRLISQAMPNTQVVLVPGMRGPTTLIEL